MLLHSSISTGQENTESTIYFQWTKCNLLQSVHNKDMGKKITVNFYLEEKKMWMLNGVSHTRQAKYIPTFHREVWSFLTFFFKNGMPTSCVDKELHILYFFLKKSRTNYTHKRKRPSDNSIQDFSDLNTLLPSF